LRAKALIALAHMSYFRGDFESTSRQFAESLSLGRQIEDAWAVAFSLFGQALVTMEMGRPDETLELSTEAYAVAKRADLVSLVGVILDIRTWSAYLIGDRTHLESWLDEALTALRRTTDTWARGMGLNDLAVLRLVLGQHEQAVQLSREALVVWQELRERHGAAWTFENLASAAAEDGQNERAARLWGASAALRESMGARLPPTYQDFRDRHSKGVRESLGEIAFDKATVEGRAMSLTQAIQYARAEPS
jgi:non-specific serine/threonine protein kinase